MLKNVERSSLILRLLKWNLPDKRVDKALILRPKTLVMTLYGRWALTCLPHLAHLQLKALCSVTIGLIGGISTT